MKIQLKRSNQLDGDVAKEPSLTYMEYGELAVNYNTADPAIFVRASDGAGTDQIVRIAGAGAAAGGMPEGPTADRPGTPSVGDLYFDTDINAIVYWNGTSWQPVSPATIMFDGTSGSPPTTYPVGTLWFNTAEGEASLYILYEDTGAPAQGKIWVQVGGAGGDGGAGSADVFVGTTAPNPDGLEEGALWWNSNSDNMQLYVLYEDTASPAQGKIWVEASPMPSSGDFDDDYVQKDPAGGASQNIAGDITLGTDKITLDATSGNASFTGDLFITKDNETIFFNDSSGNRDGYIQYSTADNNLSIGVDKANATIRSIGTFEVFNQNVSSSPLVVLSDADGSATFVGDVTTGTYLTGADGVRAGIRARSTGVYQSFAPGITGNSSILLMRAGTNEDVAFRVNADGSANFAGEVDVRQLNAGTPIHDAVAGVNVSSFRRSHSGLNLDCELRLPLVTDSTSPTGQSFLTGSNNGTQKFNVGTDGSANFVGEVSCNNLAAVRDTTNNALVVGTFGNNNAVKIAAKGNGLFLGSALTNVNNTNPTGANINLNTSGAASFAGTVTAPNVFFNLEPDNLANYTTTTEEYEEQEEVTPYVPAVPATYDEYGNELTAEVPAVEATYQTVTKTREISTYTGPTLDVKDRLQNLISRLDALESDEIADDATSTLLLTTVNNINAQMTKVNDALTAIRAAANAAGTLDQLKTDIAAATADI